jgi:hypothetical protein
MFGDASEVFMSFKYNLIHWWQWPRNFLCLYFWGVFCLQKFGKSPKTGSDTMPLAPGKLEAHFHLSKLLATVKEQFAPHNWISSMAKLGIFAFRERRFDNEFTSGEEARELKTF